MSNPLQSQLEVSSVDQNQKPPSIIIVEQEEHEEIETSLLPRNHEDIESPQHTPFSSERNQSPTKLPNGVRKIAANPQKLNQSKE